jgi:hypothetical protein
MLVANGFVLWKVAFLRLADFPKENYDKIKKATNFG